MNLGEGASGCVMVSQRWAGETLSYRLIRDSAVLSDHSDSRSSTQNHVHDRLAPPDHAFRGWLDSEIPACSPIVAVMDGGYPVSVCFCATRNSAPAVQAGLETAAAFRGRGLAPRVTAAWACAIRSAGRIPLYSTSWSNAASLAVARKLDLVQYASDWSLVDTNRPQGG